MTEPAQAAGTGRQPHREDDWLDRFLTSAQQGDAATMARQYAADAALTTPDGHSIAGREEITEVIGQQLDLFAPVDARLERIDVESDRGRLDWRLRDGPRTGQRLVSRLRRDHDGRIAEHRIEREAAVGPAAPVRLVVRPPVATLWLDRPEKRNAVTQPMLALLTQWLAEIAADSRIGAVRLAGNGPDFCAGEDVTGFDFPGSEAARRFLEAPLRFFTDLEVLPKPVVVAVHGHALGFGSEVLLAADAVLAAADATFGFAEIDHGAVASVLVTRGLGSLSRRAVIELAVTGRRLDAEEAQRLGLVHEVVGAPEAAAEREAAAMAGHPAAPVAVVKHLLGAGAPDDHDRARGFMPSVLSALGSSR